jgi:preprotein translocase subunit SecE
VPSNQRYVTFAYLAFAVLAALTLGRIFTSVASAGGLPDPPLLGNGLSAMHALGFVAGIGAAIALWKNAQAQSFTTEVVAELNKVTWPSKKETQTATGVVIMTTLLMSLIMLIYDQIWGHLTSIIYK